MYRKSRTPQSKFILVQMGLEVRGSYHSYARLKKWAKRMAAREQRQAQKRELFESALVWIQEDRDLQDAYGLQTAHEQAVSSVKALRDANPEDFGLRTARYATAANGDRMVIASCG